MSLLNVLALAGGVSFFFFGLGRIKHGLKMAAGDRPRIILGKVTKNRFFAVGLGAFLTFITQSSSTTTALLVSFADTQLISLSQAIGLILGADIGTTFTVILLSFKRMIDYSLLLVAVGVFLEMVAKRRALVFAARIMIGFGLLFFGIHMMVDVLTPFNNDPYIVGCFGFLGSHPILNMLIAAILTAVVHTSAATIGIAIALSFAGILSFEVAIPVILGANIGTCISAIIAGSGAGVRGKRVAVGHLVVKVTAVALVFPFIGWYVNFVNNFKEYLLYFFPWITTFAGLKIALTHFFFNVFLALLFVFLIGPLTRLIEKWMPLRIKDAGEKIRPGYLDETALENPALAFEQARQEILRIAEMTSDLFSEVIDLFDQKVDIDLETERVDLLDNKIDSLEKSIRFYFAKLSQESLTEDQANTELDLLTIAGKLEDIGDIVSKGILLLARKKSIKGRIFSKEGWQEMQKFHSIVMDSFKLMFFMLSQPNEEILLKAMRHEENLNILEQELRQSHLIRLHEGRFETFETSSIHLDLLSNVRLINSKVAEIIAIAGRMK